MSASDDPSSHDRRPDLRPMSRAATRLFVIASVILAFALAIAGSVYLVRLAREAEQERQEQSSPPPDSLSPDSLSTDSLSTDSLDARSG